MDFMGISKMGKEKQKSEQILKYLREEYASICEIDLEKDIYTVLMSSQYALPGIGENDCYSKTNERIFDNWIESECKQHRVELGRIENLKKAFLKNDRIEYEYRLTTHNKPWRKVVFYVLERNNGLASKVIMSTFYSDKGNEICDGSCTEKCEIRKQIKNYQDMFLNTAADTYSDLLKINLETWETVRIKFEDGKIVERKENEKWDGVLEGLLSLMEPKERSRVKSVCSIEKLKKAQLGDTYTLNYRSLFNSRTGDYRWYTTKVKILEEDGKLVATIFSLDNTETANKERIIEENKRKLKESESVRKQYEDLFLSASVDMYVEILKVNVDTGKTKSIKIKDNKIVEVPLYESIKELKDVFTEKMFPEYREEALNILNSVINSDKYGEGVSYNYQVKSENIQEEGRWYTSTIRVMEEEENKVLTLFTVDNSEAVNERKKLVEAQKQLLEVALTQAKDANKAKSTFLSNMSHDIRTPMNAIIGFTSLAAAHLDDKQRVEDYLQKIKSSSNHLLSLINDVLDMSRIESGKVQIEEKECNLSEIIHELKDIIQPQIQEKQLDFHIDTVGVVAENIYCDKLRLNQVLINLLSNAVKFTPENGTVSIKIEQLKKQVKDYALFEFTVKDTGIGISEEFAKRIFEPFEREKKVDAGKIQGTGLGMAITKNIVDMMGGTISLKSEIGKGTEFTVRLDLRVQPSISETEKVEELKGLRALVVDEELNTCESIVKMLNQMGIYAEWASSQENASARIDEALKAGKKFDIYILDCIIADKKGVEVVKKIKQQIGKDEASIILISYDWTDIEDGAKEAGVNYFCSRPIFMSDLKKVVLNARGIIDNKSEQEKKEKDFAQFEGKRILLAEDNEMNREIAKELLKYSGVGFIIEEAEDGAVAVEKVKVSEEGYYDLILMDIEMPNMNGYEATRAIKQLPRKDVENLPIIAMTANAFEEDKRKALENGMATHITKPIEINKFLVTLEEILNKKK